MIIKDFISIKELAGLKRTILESLRNASQDPEKVKAFVRFMMSTKDYSFQNRALIHWQLPEATQVMGKKQWLDRFKREVVADAQSIKILAPVIKKDEILVNGVKKKDEKLIGFRTVQVYDISQTEGEEIVVPTLTGLSVENPDQLFLEILFMLGLDNFNVEENPMEFKVLSRVEDKTITLNEKLTTEGKIVEILSSLAKINLQHFDKRKAIDSDLKEKEATVALALVGSLIGKPINVWIDIDNLEDKSITAIFKAADKVSNLIGETLEKYH